MQNNSKAYDMMKNEIKETLKNFDKIIKVNEVDIDYFNKQSTDTLLAKIQEKLNLNKEETKIANMKEDGKKKEKLNLKAIELNMEDDFRNFNMYIPKLRINETMTNKNTFNSRKSVYDDCLVQKLDDLKMCDNELVKVGKLIKLDKFQKYNVDPHIFLNKFYSYSYTDETDKKIIPNKKMNGNLIYNALNKAIAENTNNINRTKNPLFDVYLKLYQWEEKESELESFTNKIREDELNFDPKDDNEELNEKKRDKKAECEIIKKNLFETSEKQYSQSSQKYKEFILKKTKRLNMRSNEKYASLIESLTLRDNIIFHLNGSITFPSDFKIINFNSKDTEDKKKAKEERYDHTAISFGIMIKGIIEKKIRKSSMFHTRGIMVEGPIATWYSFNDGQEIYNEVKGIIDLRRKENRVNEDREDKKILLKRFQKEKHGEEFADEIEFKAEPLEFYGKTFKDIFNQVRIYYNILNNIKNKVDYSKLKYLSDSQIISYVQSPFDVRTGIIETLDWHLKLKKLHLKGIDKNYLKFIFNYLINSEIYLESLSLESAANSTNLNNNSIFELEVGDSMKTYFSSKLCERLTDIHFINFRFENGLKNLLDCLALKFDYIKKNLKNDSNHGLVDIPYRNITIKRKELSLYTVIDFYDLFQFFMKMADVAGGIDKFKQAFEKLDISGCDTVNVDGLKNIINKFKIIKELDISGTRILKKEKIDILGIVRSDTTMTSRNEKVGKTSNYLINNIDFLRSINFKHNFYEHRKNVDDEANFVSKMQKTVLYHGFDYSHGLLPVLQTIYAYETPITKETFIELIHLYRRLKFFKSFHISDHPGLLNLTTTNSVSQNNESMKHYLFTTHLNELSKENEIFCENMFEVEFYDKPSN